MILCQVAISHIKYPMVKILENIHICEAMDLLIQPSKLTGNGKFNWKNYFVAF